MKSQSNPCIGIRSGVRAGETTVYGTPECGWTQKQLEYLQKKKISYQFVDCSENKCPSFVDGYPTIVHDNKIFSGFTEF